MRRGRTVATILAWLLCAAPAVSDGITLEGTSILRDGELVQYDTPDRILAEPANEFVADFVGADRGLKRLRVWRLGDLELDPATGEDATGLTAPEDTSLSDALSVMLVEGKERLTVLDEDGRPKGAIPLEAITRLIGPEARTAKS